MNDMDMFMASTSFLMIPVIVLPVTNLVHCSEVGIKQVLAQHLTGRLEAVHICTIDTGKSNLQGAEYRGLAQ